MYPKHLATLGVVLIASISGTTAVNAQTASGETNVKVEGFFTGTYANSSLPNGITTEMLPLPFELIIEQDVIAPMIVDTFGTVDEYDGVEHRLTVRVFDDQGNVLFEESRNSTDQEPSLFRVATSLALPQGPEIPTREGFSSQIHIQDEVGIRRLDLFLGAVSEFYFWDGGPFSQQEEAAFAQPEPLFASYGGFPTFLIGDNVQPIDVYVDESTNPFSGGNPNEFPEENSDDYSAIFYGYTTTISALIEDIDGDGIPDEADSCVESLTDATVMFQGWYDSEVENYVDESGCTIMDRYAACGPQEQEQTSRFSRFQPRYSGPSYCQKQVSYGLVDEGIIDYAEARILRDALYMSYRSQPR